MKRGDGRAFNQLREVKITPGYLSFAEGSVLIEMGKTHIICAASLDDKVPAFLKGTGRGWVTAEYSMLPRSTLTRTERDSSRGRINGRSQEIQRLIGRSLRAVTDLGSLGERQIVLDCDVIQADGGTRTASITGAYVALYQALKNMKSMGLLSTIPSLKIGRQKKRGSGLPGPPPFRSDPSGTFAFAGYLREGCMGNGK